jgi:hypothetical protein
MAGVTFSVKMVRGMAFKRAGVSRQEEGRGWVFGLDGEGMQLMKGAGNEGAVLFMKKNECDHSHCPCEASSAGRSRYLGKGTTHRRSTVNALIGYGSPALSSETPQRHMPPVLSLVICRSLPFTCNVLHVMESFQLRFDDQQGCEQGCIKMFALPVHWAGNSEAVCVNCL